MSSILRQIILKTSDVNKFVKKYKATSSVTPEEWARNVESSLFPGVLVFSLEYSSSASSGLSLIQKKDSDSSEPFYRVKDLSIVVQHDNGKALVVFLTNNAFELRFLEPLLIKEARKAILDDKEFNYIIARPNDSLSPANLEALSLLSTNYAQGGSRRGFTNANNPNLNEPGLALLSFLGFTFPSQSTSGLIKQVLDLGLVAQMICGIDTKVDEKSGNNNYYAIFTESGINDLSKENQGDSPTIFSQSRMNQEPVQPANLVPNNAVNNFSEEYTNILPQSVDNPTNIGFEHPASSSGVKPKFPDDFIEIQAEAKTGFEHPASSSGVKPKFPDDFIEIQAEAKTGFEHPASSSGVKPKFPDDFIEIKPEAKTGFEHPASSSGVKPKFPDDFIEIKPEAKTGFEHPASSGGVKPKFPDDFIEIKPEAKTGFEHPASSSGVKPKFPDDFIEIKPEANEESGRLSSHILSNSNLEIQQIPATEIIQVGFDGMATASSSVSDIVSADPDSVSEYSATADLQQPTNISLNHEIVHDSVDAPILVDNDLNMSVNSSEKSNIEPTAENSDDLLTLVFDTVDEGNVSQIDSSNIIASPLSLDNSFGNPLSKNAIVGSENELTGSISSNSLFGKMASRLSDPKIRTNTTDSSSDNNEIANQEQTQPSIKQDSPIYDFNTSSNSEIANYEIEEIGSEGDVQSTDSIVINVEHAEQMYPDQIEMTAPSLGLNQPGYNESIDSSKVKIEASDFNANGDLSQNSKPQAPNSIIIESPPVTINETREIDSTSVNFMRKPKVSSSTKTTGTKLKAIMQDSNTDTDTEIYNIETSSLLNNEKLIDNEFADNDPKNSEISTISDKVSLADVLEEIVEESLPSVQQPQQLSFPGRNKFAEDESAKSLSLASINNSSVASSDSNIKAVQDPKLMMIEVASFVNKLEEQVAKASLKLKIKLDETKLRLGHQAELLYADLTNQASTIENSITDLCINLGTRLEQNYQDANVKLSDYIANQRYDIKHKSQNFDEDLQNLLDDAKSQIGKEFKDMIDEFNQFLKLHNNSFKDFVESNKSTLSGSINLIETELSSIESEYIGKLNQRLNRFQERISQEVESVIKSLERNVMSMSEEVSGSWFRASEQLNLNKADFEHTVNHYIKTSETTVVLIKQQILLEKILPALARFRDTTKDTCEVKLQAFNDLLLSIEISQMDTFNDEINNYLNSFKDNLDLFEQNLEVYTQTQQNGYESIFNDIAQDLEKTTLDLLAQIETAHKNINSNDELCKNLSKVNIAKEDPHLQQEKLSMSTKIELLKKESNKKLNTLVNKKCEDLDMLATQMQAKLSDSRNNSTQEIKEASEEGIQKIRQALQQAFKEIQIARDKCYSD